MTNNRILFIVLIVIFVVTTIITLLGVLKVIEIDYFYLKGLFGAFLLELSATIFSIAKRGDILEKESLSIRPSKACSASLKLHIWGDNRTPEKISDNNIFRWYYLQNIVQIVNDSGNIIRQHISCVLFVSFEDDAPVSTVKVSSPDIDLPLYEVKDFNQRYAIIAFSGVVNTGTLEINCRHIKITSKGCGKTISPC